VDKIAEEAVCIECIFVISRVKLLYTGQLIQKLKETFYDNKNFVEYCFNSNFSGAQCILFFRKKTILEVFVA